MRRSVQVYFFYDQKHFYEIKKGKTDTGIQVHAFITRIAIDKDEPKQQQFEMELKECKAPSANVAQSYPASLIL